MVVIKWVLIQLSAPIESKIEEHFQIPSNFNETLWKQGTSNFFLGNERSKRSNRESKEHVRTWSRRRNWNPPVCVFHNFFSFIFILLSSSFHLSKTARGHTTRILYEPIIHTYYHTYRYFRQHTQKSFKIPKSTIQYNTIYNEWSINNNEYTIWACTMRKRLWLLCKYWKTWLDSLIFLLSCFGSLVVFFVGWKETHRTKKNSALQNKNYFME